MNEIVSFFCLRAPGRLLAERVCLIEPLAVLRRSRCFTASPTQFSRRWSAVLPHYRTESLAGFRTGDYLSARYCVEQERLSGFASYDLYTPIDLPSATFQSSTCCSFLRRFPCALTFATSETENVFNGCLFAFSSLSSRNFIFFSGFWILQPHLHASHFACSNSMFFCLRKSLQRDCLHASLQEKDGLLLFDFNSFFSVSALLRPFFRTRFSSFYGPKRFDNLLFPFLPLSKPSS